MNCSICRRRLAVGLLACVATLGGASSASADVVDDYQTFLGTQMAATQRFIDDERVFLAGLATNAQAAVDDEQAFLDAQLAATQRFVDDEQAFLARLGCSGTCFNLQPFIDDEQVFLAEQQAALNKFIDDEQAFGNQLSAGTDQFIRDEQAFLARQEAALQKLIDDEQAFASSATVLPRAESALEEINSENVVLLPGTPFEEAGGLATDLNQEGIADVMTCYYVFTSGSGTTEYHRLSSTSGPCNGNPSERCYYEPVDFVLEEKVSGRTLARQSLYKSWCGIKGKRITSQARSNDVMYSTCFSGPTASNLTIRSKKITSAHWDTGFDEQIKQDCGPLPKTYSNRVVLDFFSSGQRYETER